MYKIVKSQWQMPVQLANVRFASHNRVKPMKMPKKPLPNEMQKLGPQIESMAAKLNSKGYLRPFRGYNPPHDVQQQITSIAEGLNIKNNTKLSQQQKFQFLSACFTAFKHSVPNSQLHEVSSLNDVIAFYQTPVDVTLPLDPVNTVDLPENLHIQHEPLRFHPQTDTMFGGKTAFPKSSTIVTGLKYKDKYKGHIAKKSWP
jgi:large subunit ribosomal protein L50